MLQENENIISPEDKVSPPEPGAPFNPVEDVIYKRRSVRVFKKKQVPEYLVRRVIEAGRFAPSAGNAQTWKFIVVQDQNMINAMTKDGVDVCKKVAKFFDYTKPETKGKEKIAKFMQRLIPNMLHPTPFYAIKLIAEGKLGLWHGAPTVIPILVDVRTPGKPMLDAGIAGQNMVLAAHSMGLATCWVSFITTLERIPKWKKRLGIQYPYKLATSIALGYPKGNPDGYVERETQAIDWFGEDGTFNVKY